MWCSEPQVQQPELGFFFLGVVAGEAGKEGGGGHSSWCHVVVRKLEIAEDQGCVKTFLKLAASASTLSALV